MNYYDRPTKGTIALLRSLLLASGEPVFSDLKLNLCGVLFRKKKRKIIPRNTANHKVQSRTTKVRDTARLRPRPERSKSPVMLPSVATKPPGRMDSAPASVEVAYMNVASSQLASPWEAKSAK